VGRLQLPALVFVFLEAALVVGGCGTTPAARNDTGSSRLAAEARVPENWHAALASDDLHEVIKTLHALAKAGPAAREAEQAVAALLTVSARGKHLSRWAYYALTKISEHPEQYTDRYSSAAAWVYEVVVEVGDEAVIGGPLPPEVFPPNIPEDLRAASRRAWATGIKAVIEALLRALEEGDRRDAQLAERALQEMGAPPDVIVPRLAEVLDQQTLGRVRWTAAHLIGECGATTEDMKPLLSWVDDPDPGVRASVLWSLGRIVSNDIHRRHDKIPGDANSALAAGALVEALSDPEPEVRRSAAGGLRQMGHRGLPAADALVAALRNDPTQGSMAALAGIAQDLGFSDAEGLAEVGRKAVPAIVSILRAGLERNRGRQLAKWAAYHLGSFRGAAAPAIPHLRRILRDPAADGGFKAMVIQTLGSIGPAAADAVSDILVVLERWQAKKAEFLRKLPRPRSKGMDKHRLVDFRQVHGGIGRMAALSLKRIAKAGDRVEKALLSLLAEEDPWARQQAVEALGVVARESKEVLGALERLRHDENEDVRAESAKAIDAIHARATDADADDAQDVF